MGEKNVTTEGDLKKQKTAKSKNGIKFKISLRTYSQRLLALKRRKKENNTYLLRIAKAPKSTKGFRVYLSSFSGFIPLKGLPV